jgi:hypothetical protein
VLEDFDLLENSVKSLSNEEAEDLNRLFDEAIPWLERRLDSLKVLAGDLENHCWTLLNYEGAPLYPQYSNGNGNGNGARASVLRPVVEK